MSRVEFVPPGRSRLIKAWLSPRLTWGVALMLCPWCFDVGLEVWRFGAAVNVGPLSLGFSRLRDHPARNTAGTDLPVTPRLGARAPRAGLMGKES